MAQLCKPPQRYTHPEWTYNNQKKYRNAELERMAAERLQNECDRLMDETEKRTEKSLADVNKKLDQRLDNIKFWKDELDKKLEDADRESDKLVEYIKRLEKAIESLHEPLHISQQCLCNRENRKCIDLVHDDVQKELLKEGEVIRGGEALLQKTLEQAREQLRLNRKAQFRLKNDASDKLTAKNLDEYCRSLTTHSEEIRYTNAAAAIDPNSLTPEQWQEFSNENILNMERQLQNSANMRSIIDGILQQVANDISQQKQIVDMAFKKRISETRDAKGKMEEHLQRVLKEISNAEDTLNNVELAIKEKENPMKLAQTRLEVRAERKGVENCRDSAQYRLVEEVHEISCDIESLYRRREDVKTAIKGLIRRQLDLEEGIQLKANSLFIDEVECMNIRESIKISTF